MNGTVNLGQTAHGLIGHNTNFGKSMEVEDVKSRLVSVLLKLTFIGVRSGLDAQRPLSYGFFPSWRLNTGTYLERF